MKRNTGLDVLRGIAVILVLFRHFEVSKFLTFIGWIGVDLFFVLSGFLVSGLLFKEYKDNKNIDFKKFFIRRGFKIYPSFYFFLITGTLFVGLCGDFFSVTPFKIIAEVFFMQSYVDHIWNHTWSLAVEEHFYIFIIVLFALAFNIKTEIFTKRIVISGCAILFIVFLLRCLNCFLYYGTDVNLAFASMATHLRLDSLTFGMLLSLFYHFYFDKLVSFFEKYSLLLSILSFVLITPVFYFPVASIYISGPGLSMLYIAFGIITIKFVLFDFNSIKPQNTLFILRGLTFVGFYSYNIYLWHMPVKLILIDYLLKDTGLNSYVLFISYVITSIVLGYFISITIEKAGLHLREKYFPSKI